MSTENKIQKFYKDKGEPNSSTHKITASHVYLANIAVINSKQPVKVNVVEPVHVEKIKSITSTPPVQPVVNPAIYAMARPQSINIPSTYLSYTHNHPKANKLNLVFAAIGCTIALLIVILTIGPGFNKVAGLLAKL